MKAGKMEESAKQKNMNFKSGKRSSHVTLLKTVMVAVKKVKMLITM